MKDCDDYRATIYTYLHKELNGPDTNNFHAHLQGCQACRIELDAEARLSAMLYRSRPLYSAPEALRARVILAANSFSPTALDVSARLRKRIATVFALPLHAAFRRSPNRLALVAASLAVAASLLLLPGILRRLNASSYIETAIAAHRSFLNGGLPLEIQSGSPDVVAAWFAGKVPFNFRLPSSPEQPANEQVYRLNGGRLVNYKGGSAALMVYQMQQQKISLLISSSKYAAVDGGEEISFSGIVFHFSRQANLNVITWSNHGLTYALVSSLPGTGRQSCLVCHQNMADSKHFSAHR